MDRAGGPPPYVQLGAKLKCKSFDEKTAEAQAVINEALCILGRMGLPTDQTPRRLERMALAFLAVAGVRRSSEWRLAKDEQHGRSLTTREIIAYVNENLGESISSGSYDDIRRKDLAYLVRSGVVIQSSPDSARNDSRRGYSLPVETAEVVRAFGQPGFDAKLEASQAGRPSLTEILSPPRNLEMIEVSLPSGLSLKLERGKHNELQALIIQEFLPRFGFGAEVLYVGDAKDKLLHYEKDTLERLGFFTLDHGELPDVVAYSGNRNWLYLVEAVHSANPISPLRLDTLKGLTKRCSAELIYVSAFLDRAAFRKFTADIAWETEVWIAEDPEHLIHFDGEKFLGPYLGKA